VKREALTHPKLYDLACRLEVTRVEAIGYLTLLIDWASDYAAQGDIGKWPDRVIAMACDWHGNAGAFIGALVGAGWLDEHAEHRLIIHDWPEHAQTWVRAKLAKAKKDFLACYKPGVASGERSTERTGEPSPEASPVASAEPSPVASIEPSPEASPVASAEPSPVASIEASPEASIEASAEASPEPTTNDNDNVNYSEKTSPYGEVSPETPEASSGPPDVSPPSRWVFPVKASKASAASQWALPERDLAEYRRVYGSHLAVEDELHKAQLWLRSNPAKRKTAGGMLAFLTKWLNRTSDRTPVTARSGDVRGAPDRNAMWRAVDEACERDRLATMEVSDGP